MYGSIAARCCRLALGSAAALALTIAPCRIVLHGSIPTIDATSAQAAKGGGNNGGGRGSRGGKSGNGGNCAGCGSNDSGGDGGNGSSGPAGGAGGGGKGRGDRDASHPTVTTGDKVDTDDDKITVQHPDGMTEKIENGRFTMQDALGRTIIDRRAKPADVRRLKAM